MWYLDLSLQDEFLRVTVGKPRVSQAPSYWEETQTLLLNTLHMPSRGCSGRSPEHLSI